MGGRNVTVCAGISSYGKSTFSLRYLVNAPLSVRFLFDAEPSEFNPNLNEFSDRLGLTPARDRYELALALCNGWVAFDPHAEWAGRLDEALAWFCDWAWEMSATIPGEKVIEVDEVWRYCSPHSIPEPLQVIVQSGRKRGLRAWLNTQEPNRLNGTILGGVSELVCFRLQHKRSLEIVAEQGFDSEEVSKLEKLQFISRNLDSGGELRGRITL